jgi:hypothetical protein
MATVNDGTNPGRQGATPQRQSPAPARQGHGGAGLDPTEQNGQTPPDIFGFAQSYSTGAHGSTPPGRHSSDVTVQPGQLDDGLSYVTGDEITDTGLHGSPGASNQNAGPDTVTYTDPFGIMGGVNRDVTTAAHIDGIGDWTQANDQGYAGGATLPALEGNRPVSTGIGSGSVRGAGHPDAMDSGTQPRPAGNPNAGR